MLSEMDLDKIISKEDYKIIIKDLFSKLGELQRKTKDAKIPVMFIFEGWDAAGKGTLINKVLQALDPRGFNVYPTHIANENENFHPFLWRFWTKTPSKGRIVFFDRSWYRRITFDRFKKNVNDEDMNNTYQDIINFERQLSEGGCIILKFFLHISKREQMKRFEKLTKDKATEWRVTSEDLLSNKHYKDYEKLYEDMIERTDAKYSPWVIVESNDKNYATIKIFRAIINAMEKALMCIKSVEIQETSKESNNVLDNLKDSSILAVINKNPINENIHILENIDLTLKIDNISDYKRKLKYCQAKLRELEHEIHKKRIPVVIVYEGWDASGKGGNIRRFVENLDPRGYEVVPIAAPNDEEKAHHYMWRFWKNIPKDGHIAIFDRSWYGRVLVERVEGLCSVEDFHRGYKEINEMEEHLSRHGCIVGKFWLQIDIEEQLKRFRDRESNVEKNWKITSEDWRNREKWDLYKEAVNDMLKKTNTSYAPWTIVESNDKHYGRIKVYETVIKLIESRL